MAQEITADHLGPEWAGYVLRTTISASSTWSLSRRARARLPASPTTASHDDLVQNGPTSSESSSLWTSVTLSPNMSFDAQSPRMAKKTSWLPHVFSGSSLPQPFNANEDGLPTSVRDMRPPTKQKPSTESFSISGQRTPRRRRRSADDHRSQNRRQVSAPTKLPVYSCAQVVKICINR